MGWLMFLRNLLERIKVMILRAQRTEGARVQAAPGPQHVFFPIPCFSCILTILYIYIFFFSNKNHWNMELIEKEWCKHRTVDRIFIWNLRNHIASWILLTWVEVLEEYVYVHTIYIYIFVKVTTLRLLASSDRQKSVGAFFTAAQSALVTCVMPNQGGKPGCKGHTCCQCYQSWIMSYHVQRLKAAASNDYKHIIVYKSWKSFWPLAWRFEYRKVFGRMSWFQAASSHSEYHHMVPEYQRILWLNITTWISHQYPLLLMDSVINV